MLCVLVGTVLVTSGCVTSHGVTLEPVAAEEPKELAPSANTLYALSRLYLAQDKDDEGEAVLVRLLAEFPDYTLAYSDLARVRLKQGRFEDAVEIMTISLEYGEKDPVLHNNLGLSQMLATEYERALMSFQTAKELSPHNKKYQSNIALTYGLMGNTQQSADAYRVIMSEEDTLHNINVINGIRDPDHGSGVISEDLIDVLIDEEQPDTTVLDGPQAGSVETNTELVEDLQAAVGEGNKKVIIEDLQAIAEQDSEGSSVSTGSAR
ncbi:MAG: tetratricopeptide repeat protein [Candidatus Hydrogenedentota bacterium]